MRERHSGMDEPTKARLRTMFFGRQDRFGGRAAGYETEETGMKNDMHQTPGIPGTDPVTDNPNPSREVNPVNPSGPTTGTEGWGLGEGEGKTTGVSQGRLGSEGANTGGTERTFRCADVGNADCRWEIRGQTEEQMLPQIERHNREVHGQSMDEKTRGAVLDAIHKRRAA